MEKALKEIGRDSVWYFLVTIAYSLFGFMAVPVLTRLLSRAEYGVYSLAVTTIFFGNIIFTSWIGVGVVRYFSEHEDESQLRTLYSTALYPLPFLLFFLIVIVLPLSILFFPYNEHRTLVALCVLVLSGTSLSSVMNSLFLAKQQAKAFAFTNILEPFGRYVLGVLLILGLGFREEGILWGWLAALVVILVFQVRALRVRDHFKKEHYSPQLWRKLLAFGLPLSAASIMSWVLSLSDRYMVEFFHGAAEVGLYAVIYTITQQIFHLMSAAVYLGGDPVIIKTYEREGEAAALELIKKLHRYMLILIIPGAIGLYVLRVRIMDLLVGADFVSARDAILPLILGLGFHCLSWFPLLAYKLRKKTKRLCLVLALGACCNIVLNLLLIPQWGYLGAAAATGISFAFYYLLACVDSRKYMLIGFPWRTLCLVGGSSLLMAVVLLVFDNLLFDTAWALLLCIFMGFFVYALMLTLLGELQKQELHALKGLAADRLSKILPWINVE